MKKNILLIALLACCVASIHAQRLYKEPFRPQFQFSPAIHWTNDPNGLVFHNGEYHLFYQYNPMGIRWGHMSWGHAISKDLVHWQHLPVAIEEGKDGMIFSGTCFTDAQNSSGLGKDGKAPLLAIYTAHTETNQSQHLAYSNDDGRTWTKYSKNPVLDIGKANFRDPKVFWYEPDKKWVMVLALPEEKQMQFYSSTTLKEWKLMSQFGPAGDTTGIWECPDLVQIPIANQPGKTKWMLMHSPAPYMQYFIGEFDGNGFKSENPITNVYRPDYGPDYYAAIMYNNLPQGTAPISIGWVNNWNYAGDIPTMPWRGAMSFPRSLSVKKINNEWILIQEPIKALNSLRFDQSKWMNLPVDGIRPLPVKGQQFELELELSIGSSTECGVQIASGTGHEMVIGYNSTEKKIYIDRSKTANQQIHKKFAELSRYQTSLSPASGKIHLRIFFDNSIVTVFANKGEAVLTTQIFPGKNDDGVQLFSKGGKATIIQASFWQMKSIW